MIIKQSSMKQLFTVFGKEEFLDGLNDSFGGGFSTSNDVLHESNHLCVLDLREISNLVDLVADLINKRI